MSKSLITVLGRSVLAVPFAIASLVGVTVSQAAPVPVGPVVSLQFGGSGDGTTAPFGALTNAATTAGVVPVANWNYQMGGLQDNFSNSPQHVATTSATGGGAAGTILVDSTGANSAVTYSYTYTRVSGGQGNTFSGGNANLATEVAGVQGTGDATLTISGLTGNYSILAYVGAMYFAAGGSTEAVTLGGTTYYLLASGSQGVWTQATATTAGAAITSNYVEFANLSGASQTITIPANGNFYGLNGIQIVPTAVPEPATIGLLAIGSLAMLARRRQSA